MINTVALEGRLTREPELKTIASGTSLCQFDIAYNEVFTKDGQKTEKVHYFGVVAWGRQAEVVSEYFKKGDRIFLTGRLGQERWEDKDTGAKRSAVRITLSTFSFVEKRGDRGENTDQKTSPPDQGSPDLDDNPFSDDNLPF